MINQSYTSVRVDQAKEICQRESNCLIVDIRREDEYASVNIPNETIADQKLKQLVDLNATINLYCRSGARSKITCNELVKIGYTGIVECGCILDWNGSMEK